MKSIWRKLVNAASAVYRTIVGDPDVAKLVTSIVESEVRAVAEMFRLNTYPEKGYLELMAQTIYKTAQANSLEWGKAFVTLGASRSVEWLMSGPRRDLKRYYVLAKVTMKLASQFAGRSLPPIATSLLNLALETAFNKAFPPAEVELSPLQLEGESAPAQ